MAEGKATNIYSLYAFATAHIHGAIYRQCGLLNSTGKDVKNKEEILSLLEAVHLPLKVAIIHCPGHQKGTRPVEKGIQMADQVAKEVAPGPKTLVVKNMPQLTEEETERKVPTEEEGLKYLAEIHRLTHLGSKKMIKLVSRPPYHIPGL